MVDIIIVGFVLVAVFHAIRKIIKNQESGGCGGGCGGCSSAGQCNAYEALETEVKEKIPVKEKD